MRRPLLLIFVIVGMLAASVVAIALRPAVLGLDLQGGVEVVLEGQATDTSQVTPEAIDRSVEIIRSRVDAFGVAEPEIQTQGDTQIVVALPGADNPEQVVRDLIQPAKLVFINFERNVVNPGGETDLYKAVQLARDTTPEARTGLPTFYAFDEKTKQPIPDVPPAPTLADLQESFPNDTIPPGVEVQSVPRGLFIAFEEVQRLQTRDSGTQRTYYVFQNNPGLTGADVTEARATIQTGGLGSRERIVTLQFTGEGRQKFADITRELAQDGQLKGELQRFAIILDGRIVSNPTIDYNQYPTGIDGRNGAEINGDFSQGEAETLAKQINSGALPIDLKVVSQKQVSATLGKESLREGLIAGAVGLLLVMIFLIAYYRFLGLIAAGALIVYGVLLYAVDRAGPDHADPAGHRGHHPHHRGGGRRQRGHLRTRARGGARGQDAARGGARGLQEGHHGDHRRQRGDAGDRRDPVPVRDRRREGLRLHALRRDPAVALHGGRRHARGLQRAGRDALPARRPLHGPRASARSTGRWTSSASGSCGWRSRSSRS